MPSGFYGFSSEQRVLLPADFSWSAEQFYAVQDMASDAGSSDSQEDRVAKYQSGTPAIGDFVQVKFVARAGIYAARLRTVIQNNLGIIQWFLDNTAISIPLDCYGASQTINWPIEMSPIYINSDGAHTIRGVITGKNASSSNYYYDLQRLNLCKVDYSGPDSPYWPQHATLWARDAALLSGTASPIYFFRPTSISSCWWRQQYYMTTSAVNDSLEWWFDLAAGAYNMRVVGVTVASAPKVDWYLDGDLIVSAQDWYSAGDTFNTEKITTGVVVKRSGRHQLKRIASSKNASSSGYDHVLQAIFFQGA